MNIYLHELKAYRKSTIIWTISLVALCILLLSMFSGFSKDASDFEKLLEGYPKPVIQALGLSIESITSITGYYSFILLYIMLFGSIQAMNLGTSIISKETREKTNDFLLTKPVTRTKIITSKLLASLTLIVITNIIYIISAIITANIVSTTHFSMKIFIMILLIMFYVQLFFLALGIIVSVVVPKIKSVISVSLGTVFGFFIISLFASVINDDALRYITPFKYFDTAYIIKNSAYETSYILIELVFILVSITLSYLIYSKKDIHSV